MNIHKLSCKIKSFRKHTPAYPGSRGNLWRERGAKRGRGKITCGRIRWKSHFHAKPKYRNWTSTMIGLHALYQDVRFFKANKTKIVRVTRTYLVYRFLMKTFLTWAQITRRYFLAVSQWEKRVLRKALELQRLPQKRMLLYMLLKACSTCLLN